MNFFKDLTLLIIPLVHLGVYCVATTAPCLKLFQCENGECVRMQSLCNGRVDCSDGSDENKCNSENPPNCGKYFFQCGSKSCIDFSWVCDEEEDCDDGSDERNCTEPCKDYEFECLSNKKCIPWSTHCNDKIDCDDGSDELNCNAYGLRCSNREFQCEESYHCVSREWLCDGVDDCNDGSDEKHCGSISSTSTIPTSALAQTTEQSCPDNYCMQNAECVVIKGQYYCNCSPSFTGDKCEMGMTAGRSPHDLGVVIGISMTLIILFISIALMLFYYCKRRFTRRSTALISKTESQMPITSYSKE